MTQQTSGQNLVANWQVFFQDAETRERLYDSRHLAFFAAAATKTSGIRVETSKLCGRQ